MIRLTHTIIESFFKSVIFKLTGVPFRLSVVTFRHFAISCFKNSSNNKCIFFFTSRYSPATSSSLSSESSIFEVPFTLSSLDDATYRRGLESQLLEEFSLSVFLFLKSVGIFRLLFLISGVD